MDAAKLEGHLESVLKISSKLAALNRSIALNVDFQAKLTTGRTALSVPDYMNDEMEMICS